MSKIAVVVDSTSDLPVAERDRLGITVVPLNVHFGDTVLRDNVDITPSQFLERLGTSRQLPTTSQPSPALFEDAFRSLAEHHDAVVAITLSSKLSGTYQSAHIAAEAVAETIRVEVIDSRAASVSLALQAIRAAELAARSDAIEPLVEQLRAEVASYQLLFFADTLEFLQRGGRIGKAASMVGSVLKIKPLLRLDEGQVVPYERVRTRSKAIDGLVDFVIATPHVGQLGILHGGNLDDVRFIRDRVATKVPVDRILYSQYGPVLGAHVGPGALGVSVFEGSPALV
jgi:DegV family protein with EDD domain